MGNKVGFIIIIIIIIYTTTAKRKKIYNIIDQNNNNDNDNKTRHNGNLCVEPDEPSAAAEKRSSIAGLMTPVVTWRASPLSQFLCLRLYNIDDDDDIFLSIFLFTVFAVRCASVEFPHAVTSSRFFGFFFFLHAPKI